jgi:Guanylate-binding protein, C-terminal domain
VLFEGPQARCYAIWQGLERLTALMFSKAGPKRLGQDMVSGGVLAALATAYVDAINGGAVPTIATAWQVCTAEILVSTAAMGADQIGQLYHTGMDSTTLNSICMQGVAEAECRRAADAAEQAYVAAFSKSVEPDEGALEVEHRRALDAAAAAYEVAHCAWAPAYHGCLTWTVTPDASSQLCGRPDISAQLNALAHIGSMPAPYMSAGVQYQSSVVACRPARLGRLPCGGRAMSGGVQRLQRASSRSSSRGWRARPSRASSSSTRPPHG